MKTLYTAFQELLNGTAHAVYGRQILECKAHPDLKELVATLPNNLVVYLHPADFAKVMQRTMEMVPSYNATKNTICFTALGADTEYPVKIVKMVERYESSYDGDSAFIQTETHPGSKLAWICAIPALMMLLDSEWTDVQQDTALVLFDSLVQSEYAYLFHMIDNLAGVLPSHALIDARLDELENRCREHRAKRVTETPTVDETPTTTSVTESVECGKGSVSNDVARISGLNVDPTHISLLDVKIQKVCRALSRRALYIVDRTDAYTAIIHVTPTVYNKIDADYLKGVGGEFVEVISRKKITFIEGDAVYNITFAPDHDCYLSENHKWHGKVVTAFGRSVHFDKGSFDLVTTKAFAEDLKTYLDGENIRYSELSENKICFYIEHDCMDFATPSLVIVTLNQGEPSCVKS